MTGESTRLLHADSSLKRETDVAPPINVANMFEYPSDPKELEVFSKEDYVYSRETNPNTARCEAISSSILDGHAVVYSNGVSTFHAAVMAVGPKRVFVDHAYGGIKIASQKFQKNGYLEVLPLSEIEAKCSKGDLVHLETPMSPWGTAIDLKAWTDKVHAKGGIVIVDATIAPPPILKPFDFGADIIMHSGSKYFGGHSDVSCGVLVTKNIDFKHQLIQERIEWGTISSTFNAWSLSRSLRTLNSRVKQQIQNVEAVVDFLAENFDDSPKLAKVNHTSLQTDPFIGEQYPNGGTPTFSIELVDEESARQFPNDSKSFTHATSMGGVESSCEWRLLSDKTISPTLVRISIGIEDAEDLISDSKQALS